MANRRPGRKRGDWTDTHKRGPCARGKQASIKYRYNTWMMHATSSETLKVYQTVPIPPPKKRKKDKAGDMGESDKHGVHNMWED